MKNKITSKKSIILFFIISYTITIFTFSVGISAITSQKTKLKKVSPDYNKILYFELKEGSENKELSINSDDIIKILEPENISLIFKRMENNGNTIETYALSNGVFINEDMKKGTYFTKDELKKDITKVVFSNTFIGNKALHIKDKNGEFKEMSFQEDNVSYEKEAKVTIPLSMFKNYSSGLTLGDPNILTIISGEKESIDNSLKHLNNYLNTNNPNIDLKVYDYMPYDRAAEFKSLIQSTFMIIFVTLINSIGIAYLWIAERKKELILRKVVGASTNNLLKIFFHELFSMALISMLLSIFIQGTFSFICKGYILDMNIKLNLINIITSFIIASSSTLVTTIPFLFYLIKLHPVELLRGE